MLDSAGAQLSTFLILAAVEGILHSNSEVGLVFHLLVKSVPSALPVLTPDHDLKNEIVQGLCATGLLPNQI